MMRAKWQKSFGLVAVAAVTALAAMTMSSKADVPLDRGDVSVYVTSQGLIYDSVVNGSLPLEGDFQLLEPLVIGPAPLKTEFGPGDPGYLGGRWWIDKNPNGEMDAGDVFFSCPLLGPGREAP